MSSVPQQVLNDLLVTSCLHDHTSAGVSALSRGADPNLQRLGVSILEMAITRRNKELVRELLQKGADANANDDSNLIMALISAYPFCPEILDLLLSFGFNTRYRNRNGDSLLSMCLINKSNETLRRFMSLCPDLTIRNNQGHTVLHIAACDPEDGAAVAILLEKTFDLETKDHEGRTALDLAISEGTDESCRLLLQKGAVLHEQIIQEGSKPQDTVGLSYFRGTIPTVFSAALAKWPRQSRTSSFLLHLSCQRRDHQSLRLLLAAGADVNQPDGATFMPPITFAVLVGDLQAVKILLQHGASLDYCTRDGSSLLHLAAKESQLEIIEFLLSRKLDKNTRNSQSQRPVDLAKTTAAIDLLK